MPLQATSGAASYDAFGGGVAAVPNYIEECFSTTLYTGNGSTQTITNGIDLAGKGGLVWTKSRSNPYGHLLYDTARGATKYLSSNATTASQTNVDTLVSFNSTGFTLGSSDGSNSTDGTAQGASWTFRKKPKFFDVVTWTGTGTVNHNLGSTPGFWVYKNTGATGNWFALARKSDGTYEALYLNQTSATVYTGANAAAVGLTSTTFDPSLVFGSAAGQSYVGYAFAHNAGGFGLTGTDNVISCGSYASISGGSPVVTLGYEPQWIMIKSIGDQGDYGNWGIWDSMRGLTVGSGGTSGFDPLLDANRATQEGTTYTESGDYISPTATGFIVNPTASNWSINNSGTGSSYIYIAIRRGPMKVPTDATKVFAPVTMTGNETARNVPSGFVSDLYMEKDRTNAYTANALVVFDRLRGPNTYLKTDSTVAENFSSLGNGFDTMSGVNVGINGLNNGNGATYINYFMRRAPSFFDEVCYTGDGFGTGIKHNLGVVPELIIQKARSANQGWNVYVPSTITGGGNTCQLNTTLAFFTSSNVTNVTATQYDTGFASNGQTYVNYLFASAPGVSKVGSYTGTGTTQQINCGFTGGARFVLIKRTDSTGSWYVWDVARGIVSGNDPYLLLNSTAAEVTNTDYIDTYSAGFEISSTAPSEINASGGTFIFLAIA